MQNIALPLKCFDGKAMSPESTDKQMPSRLQCSLLPSTLTCQYKHDTIQISSPESTLTFICSAFLLLASWKHYGYSQNYLVTITKYSAFNDIHMKHKSFVFCKDQPHSTKPELRFCAGSNPTRGVSEIPNDGDLW